MSGKLFLKNQLPVIILYFIIRCFTQKKHLCKLLEMAEQLEEKYLLPEVMEVPERAEEEVFYRILKMAEYQRYSGQIPVSGVGQTLVFHLEYV